MTVELEGARQKGLTLVHEGTEYGFCGRGCRLDFEEDPGTLPLAGLRPLDVTPEATATAAERQPHAHHHRSAAGADRRSLVIVLAIGIGRPRHRGHRRRSPRTASRSLADAGHVMTDVVGRRARARRHPARRPPSERRPDLRLVPGRRCSRRASTRSCSSASRRILLSRHGSGSAQPAEVAGGSDAGRRDHRCASATSYRCGCCAAPAGAA